MPCGEELILKRRAWHLWETDTLFAQVAHDIRSESSDFSEILLGRRIKERATFPGFLLRGRFFGDGFAFDASKGQKED